MKAVKESFGRPARVFHDNYPFSQAGQRRVTRTTPLLTFRSTAIAKTRGFMRRSH
ncbi:MAG: hypothetical protein M3O33_11960 [Cyanobacteriota bacterium]|nr:hypothetical protein [Cyanobacteriota bacterium]